MRFIIMIDVEDFDADRFREELTDARVEHEGVSIRTGSRRFNAEVVNVGMKRDGKWVPA